MKYSLQLFIIFLFTCYIASGNVCAQYSFRHLTTKDGLIQGSVYYFLEDKYGYIWMSTQAGLNRFDGHTFKSFVHDDSDSKSISKGEVRGLAEAPNGDIWMGTEVGLSRYVRKTNRFQNFYLKDKKGKDFFSHHQAVYADDSTVWYLNDQEGLVRMNYHSQSKKVLYADIGFTHEFRTDIVHFDPKTQSIWLKLASGILHYDGKRGEKRYFFSGRKDDVFNVKFLVYALFSNDGKTLWLSTNKGLVELKDNQFEIHQVGIDMAMDVVFSLAMTLDGNILLTTSKSGLIIYNPNKRRVKGQLKNDPLRKNSLAGNYLSKVFVDSKGTVWANEPSGIDIIFPDSLALGACEDNPLDPNDFNKALIRGVAEDSQENIWVGTAGEGVRQITKEGIIKRFGPKTAAPQESVRGIITDMDKNTWICTRNGLFVLLNGTDKFQTIFFEGTDLAKCNYVKGIIEVSRGCF